MPVGYDRWTAVNVCLTHDPSLAGLYRAVNDFAVALDAPIVSFDDGRMDRTGLAVAEQREVRRIPPGPGWLSRECHVLARDVARLAEQQIDDADLLVVHSLFRAHAPWAARVARRRGVRYWAVPHGCLDPWGLAQRRWLKRGWLALYGASYFAGAERVIFATRREADKARPWVPTARAAVVHWPMPFRDIDDREARRQRFRDAIGVGESHRLLLTVGRLHSMKRPLETVRAFCAANAPTCHLALVGMDDNLTAAQVKATIPRDCRGRVSVVGPLSGDALTDAYLAADGYISLSFRENFGYAAAEAIGHGLPVILSPGHDLAHELPRLADQLACGWLLPDDSEASAVAAIEAFSRMGSVDASRQAMAGASWARDVLSFDRFRDSLRSLAIQGKTPH